MHNNILTAGVVVIRRTVKGCQYLVLRAYNYWDFPKGLVESGETALGAARREVAEETNIKQLDFRWGQVYWETEPYGRRKIARYFVAETDQTEVQLPISPELGRPEHHEYRWISYHEARGLLQPRVMAALDWAREISGCATPEE